MRIALVTETFLPKIDGIVNVICHFLDDLAAGGHESILLAPTPCPASYAATRVIGFHGVPFPPYPELKVVSPLAEVQPALAEFQPDLVHLFNPVFLGLAGLRAARRLGAPVTASYHTDVPGFAARWGLGFSQRPLWATFRWIYNQANCTYTPSNFTKQEIEAHGFRRVKIWPHGVDSELFAPHKRSTEWRYRLSDGHPDQPLLLYVGRVTKEKRIDWLLPVLQANPEVRLAIVGGGPALEDLKRRFIGTPTVFTGYLHGETLAEAYASADIFVFSGANETFGNVVLEAMASGLAVVAPRSGGLLDFVQHDKNGLLFDPESRPAMGEAVNKLLQNPAFARQLGLAAREKAKTMSWSAINHAIVNEDWALLAASAAFTGDLAAEYATLADVPT